MSGLLQDAPLAAGAVAFAVGAATAVFNVAAGGGSLLTVPLLVELGLGAQAANGTNRIAVLAQSAVTTLEFSRRGVMPRRALLGLLPATMTGAVAGSQTASVLPESSFKMALACVFAAMALLIMFERRPDPDAARERADRALALIESAPWWLHIAMLAIGFYGGFVQAGVGVLMLMVLHMAVGLDLVRSNALKVAITFGFTLLTIAVFVSHGLVNWSAAVWLSLGSFVGGWLGVRVVTRIDPRWLRYTLIIATWLAAARFAGFV